MGKYFVPCRCRTARRCDGNSDVIARTGCKASAPPPAVVECLEPRQLLSGTPTYVYAPSTGDVTFNLNGFTGEVQALTVYSASGQFQTGNTSAYIPTQIAGGNALDINSTTEQFAVNFNGFTSATLDLGDILPANLTQAAVSSDLSAYYAYSGGPTGPTGDGVSAAVVVPVPPTVMSVTTNDGEGDGNTTQASEVRQLVVNFSEAVNLTQPGAFSLGVYNLTGAGGAVSGNGSNDGSITDISSVLNTATSSNGGLTWTITFAPGTSNTDANPNASLIDGIYSFSINNSDVTSNGVALTGSNTYTFHRLYGDVTGTGAVNNTDARDFSKAYGAAAGAANYNAAFDFGGAGANINNADARDFSLRYGHSFSSVLPAGGIN